MVRDTKAILKVLALFPPLPLFWALFDQQGSRWIFQATRMDGDFGWFIVKPGQFSIVNPLMAILLIPIMEYCLYPLLRRIGIKSPLPKTIIGGVLAGCSFIASALVEIQIQKKDVHMIWLLPQYFLMTLGEILVTVPLMHFSYTEAPKSMKSVLQAFRLMTMASGNLAVSFIAGSRIVESPVHEFLLFAGLMFFDMIIFWFLARNYKYVDKDSVKL
jgi:proton-dependent oligopeptide transporter, POT family